MSGTVNISRSIWHDAAFKDQPLTEREAFIWMIMEASWKPREKRIGSVAVALSRGQLAASVRFMAGAWGWQKSTVDRFLKRLENRDMIGTATGTGVNVITIRKYDEYQSSPTASGTAGKLITGQQRDSSGTNEKKGEIKEEDNNIPRPSKGTRLPSDWTLPDEWGQWAVNEGWPAASVRIEGEQFRDYWISKTGKGATKRDWLATWRSWIRNDYAKRGPSHRPTLTPINGGNHGKRPNDPDQFQRIVRAAAEGTSGKDWG